MRKFANNNKMYYVYMLRCEDDSIYTGFTTDVKRRFHEHIEKNKPYGKYTRTHPPVKIEAVWRCYDRSKACSLEYHIKRLTKIQKERIINSSDEFAGLFRAKLDCSCYFSVNPDDLLKEGYNNG